MSASLSQDRRQHQRRSRDGDGGSFFVGGLPARLVDWSFGGLGVRLDAPGRFDVASEVDIRLRDRETGTWETLTGLIRRIDPTGVVGIAFADDGETTVRVLLRLLGNRMMGASV